MADAEPPALCPSWALSVGYGGVAAAACLSNWGSAWGTWKSGVSLVHIGIRHPSSVMKNVIPVVMAGVIGIYGLIVAVILAESIPKPGADTRINSYSIYTAFAHLCAGLCAGISGLAAGGCIGIVGDAGVRAVGYRASSISLFPSSVPEAAGYSTIPDDDGGAAGGDDVSGSDDQNKLFVGMVSSIGRMKVCLAIGCVLIMCLLTFVSSLHPPDPRKQLIMLIFSEALALYGLIVALIVSQHSYSCGSDEF